MPAYSPPPGITSDRPRISSTPFWATGINIRFRSADGIGETVGFVTKVKDISNAHITLPGTDKYRSALITPSSLTGLETVQMLFGSASRIMVLTYNPASLPSPGPRYLSAEITPAGYSTIPDSLPSPPTGTIAVPPNVHFVPQDDLVVILKANDVGNRPWVWDRDPSNVATVISTAPKGAVAAAIVKRFLVLLGAQSVGETGQSDPVIAPLSEYPARYLTVRWSDQYDFDNWNVSDVTLSGELQLDNGSRIVGGGAVRQGIAAFTDDSLNILTFTGDAGSVFDPKKVDGSTGLLANQAWCETEGQIWYIDTNRRLMVYDGGAPRPIPNPNKLTTVERISDSQMARAYLTANPEFDEIILAYPADDASNADCELVYNYALNVWYPWRFERTAWTRRVGATDAVAVDHDNKLYFHDIDSGIDDVYLVPPSYVAPSSGLGLQTTSETPAAADVEPFSFAIFTNPFTSGEVTERAVRQTRMHWDMLATPAVGASDSLLVHAVGYGASQIPGTDTTEDVVTIDAGDLEFAIRVGGKAIQIGLQGNEIKTHVRFGAFTLSIGAEGAR